MKSTKLFFAISILVVGLVSCEPKADLKTTVVDFENVALNSDSISNPSGFVSGNSTFTLTDSAFFWNGGIVCTSKNDTMTPGYINEYSVIAGSGALNSRHFGVVYSPGSFTCPADINGGYSIKSIMVTNSTYAYLALKNGSDFNHVFSGSGDNGNGDWFKVSITGFKNNVKTGSVDIYLADFRNGKSILLKTWQKYDVSALGQVDLVTFTFDSTDKTAGWLNIPAYACIDNIEFTQSISTK